MKKLLLILPLLAFAGVSFSQTADEIIEKYIKATGGREKYKAITSMRSSGTAKGGGMDIHTVSTETNTNCHRSETTIMGMTSIEAYDGKAKTGWYIQPFSGDKTAHKMNDEQTKGYEENPHLEPVLMIYKDLGASADFLGKEDFEGVDVYLIMITMPTKTITYYYIDAETYLILKQKSKQKFEDKEVEGETYFSDYRMENGIMMAHTTEGYNDGKVSWQFILDKIEFNVVIDEKTFVMPKDEEKKDPK